MNTRFAALACSTLLCGATARAAEGSTSEASTTALVPAPQTTQPAAESVDPEALPLPEALVPQVEFWKRVYSEIDSNHGFLHDSRQLDVVYETIAIPRNLNYRGVMRFTRNQVHHLSTILEALAHGKRDHLTAEEAAVLAKWPTNVDNATLAVAAKNVRFQTGQRDHFMAGLLRSRVWMPHIERTFAEHGLPRELAALPHVESSFDMRAYSKARAAGIWQFTQATARLYMHMSNAVDERYDPIRATEAAARLLRQNYKRIGSWPAAITAYNHGTEGMRRAVRSLGTTDIAEIVANYHTRRFGFASRNFYTELLAAWEVSHNANKYFGALPEDNSPQLASLTTDAYYRVGSVAKALGVDVNVLKAHNPALRPAVWTGAVLVPRGFTLRVPQTTTADGSSYLARLTMIPAAERYASANAAPSNIPMLAKATVRRRPAGFGLAKAPARKGAAEPVVQTTWPNATQPAPLWSAPPAAPLLSPAMAPAWVQ